MTNHAQRKFWIDFIALYKSKPTLWKVKSAVYRDRRKKRLAYDDMVEKLKEMYPDADAELVRRKINSLRSVYRRELKKIKERSGYGGKEYVPNWWCFDALQFLKDMEEGDEYENDNYKKEDRDTPIASQTKRIKLEPNYSLDVDEPQSSTQSFECKVENDFDMDEEAVVWGKVWALQFKELTPDQKLFAKKAINDILFEGEMGVLHRNSVKINENGCTNCSNITTTYPSKNLFSAQSTTKQQQPSKSRYNNKRLHEDVEQIYMPEVQSSNNYQSRIRTNNQSAKNWQMIETDDILDNYDEQRLSDF